MRTHIETAYSKCDAFNASQKAFLAAFENDQEAKRWCKLDHHDELYYYAFCCPHCGHEYYVDWREQYYNLVYSEKLTKSQVDLALHPEWKEEHEKYTAYYKKNFSDVFAKHHRINKEYSTFCETKKANCPICGTTWMDSPETFYRSGLSFAGMWMGGVGVFGDHSDADVVARIDAGFAKISEHRKKVNKEAAEKKVLSLTDLPISTNLLGTPTEVSDTNFLRQHIAAILTLETNLMSLKTWLSGLYTQQAETNIAAVERSYLLQKEPKEKLDSCRQQLEVLKGTDPQAAVKLKAPKKVVFTVPPAPEKPNYGKPGLFNKKKVEAANEQLRQAYEQEMAAHAQAVIEIKQQEAIAEAEYEQKMILAKETYQRQCKEAADHHSTMIQDCQQQIDKWEQEVVRAAEPDAINNTQEMFVKNMVDNNVQQAEDLLRRTLDARNKLYGCNVIFDKYRDPVALATFYEYLMAGRCTTLTGPSGAYNLYEAEIRANMIISQLSEVIKNLEAIRENQYMIYSQIDSMNKSLQQLSSTMSDAVESLHKIDGNTAQIAENTEVIAHNTYATAYYAKKNAELTDALGLMLALK